MNHETVEVIVPGGHEKEVVATLGAAASAACTGAPEPPRRRDAAGAKR